MKYMLIIVAVMLALPAAAHPHHDCDKSKDHNCGKHQHPDQEDKK